jgi:UDP-N-acetylglucosamine--N-acetylmuramyl-(pentapeptide) pyrophosphoryl-undecaprenol N-acetylglucosamine transferase
MRQPPGFLKKLLVRVRNWEEAAAHTSNEACMLFHAVNGIGLGHVSRLAAIALAIRRRNPSLALLFAVEGNSHGLLEAVKLPHISFPSKSGFYCDDESSWPGSQGERLTRSIAASIVDTTSPELIVFDCFPNPSLVAAASANKIPFAVCLRKFKDMDGYFQRLGSVLQEASILVIPHTSSEVNVPAEFSAKSTFVGSIVRPMPKILDRLGQSDHQRRIVISGGGGGYAGTVLFYNLALEAIARCREIDPKVSGLLVTGPLFQEWNQLKPVSGVQIIPFDPFITSLFAGSSLVICQGGYNTLAEVTALGVPVICMPAERKFDNQYERAKAMAATHDQFYLWDDSSSTSLATLILKCLQMPPTAPHTTDDDSPGATLAAEILVASMIRH